MKTTLIIINSLCALYWLYLLVSFVAGYYHPTNFEIDCALFLVICLFVSNIITASRN